MDKRKKSIPDCIALFFTFINARNEPNQPLERDYLNRHLNTIEREYQLPHITPHGLRHTFISDAIAHGMDDLYIKSIVGHANDSQVTRRGRGHVRVGIQRKSFTHFQGVAFRRYRRTLLKIQIKLPETK